MTICLVALAPLCLVVHAARANKRIKIEPTSTLQGVCLEHKIIIEDAATPADENTLKKSTLAYGVYPTPPPKPVASGVHTSDISQLFSDHNSSYFLTFAALANVLTGNEPVELFTNPSAIDYYYCKSVGVLKFGTGRSFARVRGTVMSEMKRAVGTMLSHCQIGDDAKLVICPVHADTAANQLIERSWRKAFKAANHDLEDEDKNLVPLAPPVGASHARAVLGTTGLTVIEGEFVQQLNDVKALCAHAKKKDDDDLNSNVAERVQAAKFRAPLAAVCREIQALL